METTKTTNNVPTAPPRPPAPDRVTIVFRASFRQPTDNRINPGGFKFTAPIEIEVYRRGRGDKTKWLARKPGGTTDAENFPFVEQSFAESQCGQVALAFKEQATPWQMFIVEATGALTAAYLKGKPGAGDPATTVWYDGGKAAHFRQKD